MNRKTIGGIIGGTLGFIVGGLISSVLTKRKEINEYLTNEPTDTPEVNTETTETFEPDVKSPED